MSNYAELRGIITKQPSRDITKGIERLRFMYEVDSYLNIPESFKPKGARSTAIVPVTAYDRLAIELEGAAELGMYVHELKGYFQTYQNKRWWFVVNSYDLTDSDKEMPEYEPLNKVKAGGVVKFQRELDKTDMVGGPRKMFLLSAFRGKEWDYNKMGENSMIPVTAWGEAALKAEELCSVKKQPIILWMEGKVDTWSFGGKNKWSVIADTLYGKGDKKSGD